MAGSLDIESNSSGNLTLIPKDYNDGLKLEKLFEGSGGSFHVYGLLDNGSLVTLPGIFKVGSKKGLTSYGVSSFLLRCPTVLLGDIAYKNDEMLFNASKTRFSLTEYWLNVDAIKINFDRNGMKISLSTVDPKEVRVSLSNGDNFSIIFEVDASLNRNGTNSTLIENSFIWIIPDRKMSYSWFQEIERLTWLFLTICTGEVVEKSQSMFYIFKANRVRAAKNVYKSIKWAKSVYYEVRLPERKTSYPKNFDPRFILTKVDDFENLGDAICTWFSISNDFSYIAGLIAAGIKDDQQYIELKISVAVQATESIHRYSNKEKTSITSKSNFKIFKKWLIDNLPGDFADMGEQIRGRIDNINNYSIKSRMIDAVSVSWSLISAISDFNNAEDLAKYIGDLRNNVSHGNKLNEEFSSLIGIQKIIQMINLHHCLILLGMDKEIAANKCIKYYRQRYKKFSVSSKGV